MYRKIFLTWMKPVYILNLKKKTISFKKIHDLAVNRELLQNLFKLPDEYYSKDKDHQIRDKLPNIFLNISINVELF